MSIRPAHVASLVLGLALVACGSAPQAQVRAPAARKPIPWHSQGANRWLTGDLLIADAHNNRILLVTPQKKIVWQFPAPGQPPQLHDDDDVGQLVVEAGVPACVHHRPAVDAPLAAHRGGLETLLAA